jgi:hypothetical protein
MSLIETEYHIVGWMSSLLDKACPRNEVYNGLEKNCIPYVPGRGLLSRSWLIS